MSLLTGREAFKCAERCATAQLALRSSRLCPTRIDRRFGPDNKTECWTRCARDGVRKTRHRVYKHRYIITLIRRHFDDGSLKLSGRETAEYDRIKCTPTVCVHYFKYTVRARHSIKLLMKENCTSNAHIHNRVMQVKENNSLRSFNPQFIDIVVTDR